MAVMAMCVLLSCTEKKEEATLSGLMKSNFVSEVQGKPTALYVLKNQNGAEACVTNWGGKVSGCTGYIQSRPGDYPGDERRVEV